MRKIIIIGNQLEIDSTLELLKDKVGDDCHFIPILDCKIGDHREIIESARHDNDFVCLVGAGGKSGFISDSFNPAEIISVSEQLQNLRDHPPIELSIRTYDYDFDYFKEPINRKKKKWESPHTFHR